MGKLDTLATVASKLPLDARLKLISKTVAAMDDKEIEDLIGEDNAQGAKFMAHYLGGSGEALDVGIKESDWQALIDYAEDGGSIATPIDDKRKWKTSKNPNFPASDGWEYMDELNTISTHRKDRRRLRELHDAGKLDSRDYTDAMDRYMKIEGRLHNKLGTTTLRRRKLENNTYEYQIAGEKFDFVEGVGGKDAMGDDGRVYGEKNTRYIKGTGAAIIEKLIPELVRVNPSYGDAGATIFSMDTTDKIGKPFDVIGSYIDKRGQKAEDKLIDIFKGLK